MKNKITISRLYIFLAGLFLFSTTANAQLTGTKTIPGDYANIAAAITDLNGQGVGAGGVTFNVAAGFTETAANLVLTVATNPTSATRPIVFQKSGAGANPLVTAGVGVSTTVDGVFKLNGVDYVTFNGIDVAENVANVTTTTQMEWGYALVKVSGTNACQYVTIKNCTVTLNQTNTASVGIYIGNHIFSNTTGLVVTQFNGTSSYNKFYNNTVQNSYLGYSFTGYGSAAPYDFYDHGNEIGTDGVSTRRSQVLQFGGAGGSVYGIYNIYQDNVKLFKTYINNSGGTNTTTTLNGIFTSTGVNNNVDIYNDTLQLTSNATASTLVGINNQTGTGGSGNTINIYNNVVSCTYATATSGEFRGIVQGASASYTNIYNNTVSNTVLPGSGYFYGIYYAGTGVANCIAVNIYNNTVSGNSKTGTLGGFYGINASASTVLTNTYSNQILNNSASSTSDPVYGYYNFGVGNTEAIYNNTISGLTGGSGLTYGIYAATGTVGSGKEVYGNTINTIAGNAAGFMVGAIFVDYALLANIYKNNIYNIVNNTATGPTPAVFGINSGTNINIDVSINNNFISDLKAPNASSNNAIYGIWMQGTAASYFKTYYNTVYMNATSVGANFGTAGLVCTTTPASIDLRNNILVNASTPAGTGTTRALVRGNTILTNYNLNSGYNCLYAGTPGPTKLLYSDGTNNDQTIQAFKDRVAPRDQASFSELPPFTNVAGTPYNLHILAGSPTQCESGGTAVTITTDYDGQNRYPNAGFPTSGFAAAPDCGADEIGGNMNDIASPNIVYTPLTNSGVATTRVCTGFATITDPTGINNTPGTKPRLYYKKLAHTNTIVDNTSLTNGWKYVEASNAASPFSFTIDYTILFSGSVVAGDVIQYFVIAQDLNGTPRIGNNAATLAIQPLSVSLSALNCPITFNTGVLAQYTIVSTTYSGVVPVGPTETITSLTNAGGIFALINAGALTGNLTISITGDLAAETGLNPLNQWAEEGAGSYTVSIVPSAGVQRTISGSNAASSLIRFDGADRVNIDGRFGGAGTWLTFRNTSNTAPTVGYLNDAQNNTLQYSIIESGNTTTLTTTGGAVLIGSTTLLNGNDNNTITNCEIRDRSDVAGTPVMGIVCSGNGTSALTAYNNNCTISNNRIHDWFLSGSTSQFACSLNVGNTGFTITNNSFYQTATRTQTVTNGSMRAIHIAFASTLATNGGHTITGNFIGGTAAGATGGDMTLTVSGAGIVQSFQGINVNSGLIPNSIQNNVIRQIDFTTSHPAAAARVFAGISAGQGIHNIGTITGNVVGSGSGTGSIKININGGAVGVLCVVTGILPGPISGYCVVQNNTVGGFTIGGTSSAGNMVMEFIQSQGTPSQAAIISNNLVGSVSTPNSIQVGFTGPAVSVFGIRHISATGPGSSITNNTIQNITNTSTTFFVGDCGILCTSTSPAAGTGSQTVTNNIIQAISTSAAPPSPSLAMIGIAIQGHSGTGHSISNNTISNISNPNTSVSANGYTVGIQTQGNSLGGTMSKNKIWDIRNANGGANPGLAAIYFSAGDQWTVSNNMISITNTGITTPLFLMGGIGEYSSGGTMNFYYNSIYVGGNVASGTSNSYGMLRGSNSRVTYKNNLIYNERTGGTGFQYAIGNLNATPSDNFAPGNSNNNFFITPNATYMGEWGALIPQTLAQWRTSSGGDALSFYDLNTNMPSGAIFTNAAAGNLKIPAPYYLTPSYLESRGVAIAGITTDFENDVRPGPAGGVNGGGTAPDIGADEFDGTPAVYDANDFALASPLTTGCHTNSDDVIVTIKNTGNVSLNFANTNLTVNASVAGPNPMVFAPVTLTSGTLAAGATQNVTITLTYDMTLAGTYVFSSSITMTGDEVPGNNTMSNVSITVSGGTAMATPTSICVGGTSNLSVTGYTTGGTLQWQDSPDGIVWSNIVGATNPNLAVSPTVTTYYQVLSCGNNLSNTIIVTVNPLPTVNLGPDFTTCNPSATLDAGNPGSTYSWNTGPTTQTINVSVSGTYSVTVTDANTCQNNDAVVVTFNTAPVVNLGPDTTHCGPGTILLDAANAGATYAWSTGATTQTISVSTSNTYAVTVTQPGIGCTGNDAIVVNFVAQPTVNLGADYTSCMASELLDAGNPGATYIWSNAATSQTTTVTTTGTYAVTITDANGCDATDDVTVTFNTAPVVNLGPDSIHCGPGTIVLDAGNAGATYAWSTGAITQTISVSTDGTYSVTVTEVGVGCTGTDDIDITFVTAPTVNLGPDSAICSGTIVLDAGNPGASYLWSDASTSQTLSVTSPETYGVTVTDPNGCAVSDDVNITTGTVPVVDLGADTSLCAFSLILDAGNPGASYLWSNTDVTQTTTVSVSGTYSVTVTNPGLGCDATDAITVTFTTPPIVDIGPDSTLCSGTIVLDAGNPGMTYAWSNTDITQTTNVTTPGTYTVTVTDGVGCTNSDAVVINAGSLPVVAFGPDTSLCGGTLMLDAGNAGATYAWSTAATTQTITVSASGTYSATVTNNGLGCVASDTIIVVFNTPPTVTLTLPQDTVCQELGSVTITGGLPAGGTYSGTGVTGTTFDPNVAGLGTSTITYTFTDATGCTASDTDTWFVDICTGTTDPIAGISIDVYPNPGFGIFNLHITGANGKDVKAEIWSVDGKLVWRDIVLDNPGDFHTQIDLSQVSSGMYQVKVQVDENFQVIQIVKE